MCATTQRQCIGTVLTDTPMQAIEQRGAHDARNGAVKHDEGAGVPMTGQESHMARCRQPGMPTAASAPAQCIKSSAMLSMAQGYHKKTVSLMSGAVQSAAGAQVNDSTLSFNQQHGTPPSVSLPCSQSLIYNAMRPLDLQLRVLSIRMSSCDKAEDQRRCIPEQLCWEARGLRLQCGACCAQPSCRLPGAQRPAPAGTPGE